jgi:hypothetical protein
VLVLLMGRFMKYALRWSQVERCAYQSHNDQLRHWSNIKAITSIVWHRNAGISDGKVLWRTPLRWLQVAYYTYQVQWRLVQVLKQYERVASTIWETEMLILLMQGMYEVFLEIALDGMIYIRCLLKTGSWIQRILMLLYNQFERFKC